MTTVVLLNGAGSSGKTSIARELQRAAHRPFLHVQMDAFLDMLPEELQDHVDGIQYLPTRSGAGAEVEIAVGRVGMRLLDGMRHAIVALAAAGSELIVDDVLLGDELDSYRALLNDFDFRTVGIHASLATLEQRERARGDRLPGLARWQFDRVHLNKRYDLEVDTGATSAAECAALIKVRFGL